MPAPAMTILLTRPIDASHRFARMIAPWVGARADIMIAPLMEIVPAGTTPDMKDIGGVIFTSSNGVAHAPVGSLPAYCVGARTAEAARAAGWQAQLGGANADELVKNLSRKRPSGCLLHLSGTHRRGNIAERLTEAGLPTRVAEVYNQRLLSLSVQAQKRLEREEPVIIPLFSPRLAGHLAHVVRGRAPLHLILISEAARAEIGGLKLASCTIASSPDARAMATSLRTLVERVEAQGPAG